MSERSVLEEVMLDILVLAVPAIAVPPGKRRQLCLQSIVIECFRKNSAPKMGWLTRATLKECLTLNPERFKSIDLVPKVSINEPFAALRRCPGLKRGLEEGDKKVKGITEMSAPVSTKKDNLDTVSSTDMEP